MCRKFTGADVEGEKTSCSYVCGAVGPKKEGLKKREKQARGKQSLKPAGRDANNASRVSFELLTKQLA